MNARKANELGYREAKAHPLLMYGLWGTCAFVALNLPIFWYWKIAAFLAMNFAIALARILFGVMTGHIQLSDE